MVHQKDFLVFEAPHPCRPRQTRSYWPASPYLLASFAHQRRQRAQRAQKRGIARALRRALKPLSVIKRITGRAKHDGLMGRNYLLGRHGDAIHSTSAAAGHNLRIIVRKLRLKSMPGTTGAI